MSYFGVTKEVIDKIKPHPNADRLELGSLLGMSYQFVIPKGLYKEGDTILYFPLDAVLPDDVADICGVLGKLKGSQKNRVGTVRLRQEISQGLVAPFDKFDITSEKLVKAYNSLSQIMTQDDDRIEYFPSQFDINDRKLVGILIAHILNVIKYEPPAIPCKAGNLNKLPGDLTIYDIENADREVEMFEALLDIPVIIEEKSEGSNAAIYISEDGDVKVCQRKHSIDPIEGKEHTWWKAAKNGYIDFAKKIHADEGNVPVAVYGEIIGPGIQKNYYDLPDHTILIFDIKVNGEWLNPEKRLEYVDKYIDRSKHVPVLSIGKTLREVLGDISIQDFSNGKSVLVDKLREGIVIKPMQEQRFGQRRLFIKQRSPEYLEKE